MLVTEVRKISDRRLRILMEDGSSFVLYRTEVGRFNIRPEEDLPEETYHLIMEDILKKRACERCLNLLRMSDRTVQQLRTRLIQDGYADSLVQYALDYAASYHYTDDRRYAENYIRQMSGRKSLRQMEFDLIKKGVDRETVRAALSDREILEEGAEKDAILSIARRRGYNADTAGREETARLYRYLAGKGFGYEAIRSALPPAARDNISDQDL